MAARRVMPPMIDGFTEMEDGGSDPLAELVGQVSGMPRRSKSSNKMVKGIIDQLEMLSELDPKLSDRCRNAIDALTESSDEGGASVSTEGRLFGGDVRTPV